MFNDKRSIQIINDKWWITNLQLQMFMTHENEMTNENDQWQIITDKWSITFLAVHQLHTLIQKFFT